MKCPKIKQLRIGLKIFERTKQIPECIQKIAKKKKRKVQKIFTRGYTTREEFQDPFAENLYEKLHSP